MLVMKIIGLTGGFLSGKSTVLKMFGECGAKVLDVDRMYHELLEGDEQLQRALETACGCDVRDHSGKIDRARVRQLAASNAALMARLSDAALPFILNELKARLKSMREGEGIAVVEVPLLFEKGLEREFDAVVAVTAEDSVRRARAYGRGYDEGFFEAAEQTQMPLGEKVERAEYVIINNGDREQLNKQVQVVYGEIGENDTQGHK
jgi:dephospho-CoA kinase